MDGGRLKTALSSLREKISRNKSFVWAGLVIAAVGLILFIVWWASPYVNDMYALIPGYYQNEEFNELTARKNELIAENSELLAEGEEYEAALGSVSTSANGYDELIEINSDIVAVNQTVRENLLELLEIDEELSGMHLPDVVRQYVRFSYGLDEVRLEIVELTIEIGSARRDLAEFNKKRVEFDSCLADVDWNGADATIATSVEDCAAKVDDLQERVLLMEGQYGAELDEMKNYLKLLSEQWYANANYYKAISEGDYTKASNEYDPIFVDRRRQISELDVVDILNEFYEEGIGPMLEDLVELGELEVEKEKLTNDWYQRNLVRMENQD